ncbi:unnamed protein product [Prorocentrum cordatum]|uniref:Uncharacterized protein n=1 Tax=Prorocentrum cordatum TaxID=2364126 RepID=A0ABN9VH01_9DINO|nr:unnamed protein product [Polarella glacialis]|mmetsp:Transcript_9519/g.25304  ORF Transcript_9519/g.25304 Transcript_9519/m.25304 type:complete len:121 (-) Transcript_9519:88-450(-)
MDEKTAKGAEALCSKFAGEIRDVLAYRRFAQRVWGNTTAASKGASEVLVAFHNLVTMSIGNEWFSYPKSLYCHREVRSRLGERAEAVATATPGPAEEAPSGAWARAENLVGFADRPEKSC